MGQAKNRGTFEERLRQARAGSDAIIDLIRQGGAPHYAFILDKSSKGVHVLSKLKQGPEELRERTRNLAVQMWEEDEENLFPFLVIWGTWGFSGGLTLQVRDLRALLQEALPKVMERTLEKGGLCAFLPVVAEDALDAVLSKIAEMQPTAGNQSEPN